MLDRIFPKQQTTLSFSDCPHPHWIGDSFCDEKTNVADCDYDGGDCCGYNVNTDFLATKFEKIFFILFSNFTTYLY